MKKVLFIDRDGTILVEPQPSQQVDSLDKFAFVPGAISALARIARELDYELVLVTNQDGLGTESFPEDTFWPAQQLMLDILQGEGVAFASSHIDRSFPHQNLPTRKPGIGMLTAYLDAANNYDLPNSFVIGDRLTDVELAANLGSQAILIGEEPDPRAALTTTSWEAIYQFLRQRPARTAVVQRDTNETKIRVELNLDGDGRHSIKTGLGFFDHMLDQLSKHSGVDMLIEVQGDLHIDEHHTIEDTALALGEAFAQALGDKRGLARYGFLLPMDDSLAQAAIDFSGRPWLVWNAEFRREKIGDMPTEMFYHFFKSFADAAKCNLNIHCSGENEHHKIEAIFKAVAKSARMAIARDFSQMEIPSTKGVL
ncbi:bifunctional histidinol-phosphatase/imidazoleglycerol-phosphate dehydratase HisB [Hymenobacter busanensis]|uniref:Histidine biosynthesis bifunctional protein HisB n=1 Tax=Hymenobacter busanensis TaxID=2607656 RepID=A0A7L4ZUA4_9BACT|nr:bifunctional histidinol-phosphatase/imidazoleglycerol-phosphate dehydratase HisB [Hymenobacter busanensis]KAA9339851.1 bifunctional histidinol-phosphatase/imidazoleglycerol-phosphate dehydratase HisB [Hymenobacter busanensis]QHJ06396.1 bifunctional histidinol-phosphatase/imidazoleglycerol-phosphate dehydratase HisB [Hymenobacter busanensis]